ncbi:glycosyl transferase family 2 [Yeosuana aromativorans]|uniref:Glycosyl transferase family 2 n=1 Tax=Yeosuana aromativorans TaxID=288019 RepID=A0A8J3BQR5_9FLAO|nr:glycosyltransferase [Yeosuana aromativorans]GGK26637.1 glycosyl transferase family 2 [Yeosuana aromativorans]
MTFLDFVFYMFILVVCIQVIFNLLFFGKFAFLKPSTKTPNNFGISVIICAKNEAKNLQKFLPSVVSQDYPNFEIVLINDASKDKTFKVMESFASKHNNIKLVNVKNVEAFWGNKKYALTLGIKVAKHEHLLFTDADCKPLSKDWISQMAAYFDDSKTIVLGYGPYKKIKKSLLNKLIRFETLQTAMQYLSFAKVGLPYMGVGRNLAYKKSEFFNANGFISHIDVRSGDDDLFINQVATSNNTTICFSKDSFTQSIPKTTFTDWIKQKRRHISTAKHYKFKHKVLLTLLYSSQLLFWLLAFVLLIFQFNWKIVLALLLFRLCLQFLVVGFSTKKLGEKDILYLLPFLELFLISVQLTIFINNLISKPSHWK